MANKNLFRSIVGRRLAKTDTTNEAGGSAYAFDARHALAQYAATGCLNSTFYASAEVQLDTIVKLCEAVEPEFIARAALYARENGRMKDLPALLTAILSVRGPGLMAEVFDRVIDSPKMLRNFVQVMRSGVVGRKSLGSLPKRLIAQWLEAQTDEQLFTGSVGHDPSLADIVKMVHPRPGGKSREALYGYLLRREVDFDALPQRVKDFEMFKRDPDHRGMPDVPFQMLTALKLSQAHWVQIARQGSWNMTRMNLNTFARHGVFETPGMDETIARRLGDPERVEKANAFPYQLMVAYSNADAGVPQIVRDALQDAMEHAIRNVPAIDGQVFIFPDVSGSMQSPVTGHRKGSTTAVRCIDVASLVAAAIVRKNPSARVVPFSDDVVPVSLNARDSVMTNAQKLASLPSGGTNCSAPLKSLNAQGAKGGLVVYVSDNESWVDSTPQTPLGQRSTATMEQWNIFKRRNPGAKMVCIDIQPCGSTQAQESPDITNIGGFSDAVFTMIADVAAGRAETGYWVRVIGAVSI